MAEKADLFSDLILIGGGNIAIANVRLQQFSIYASGVQGDPLAQGDVNVVAHATETFETVSSNPTEKKV